MSLIDDHRNAMAATWQPLAVAKPSPPCRYCGSTPTVDKKFQTHTGMVVYRETRWAIGPFCRDCGLTAFRRLTAKTLITGWWGFPSILITPYILIANMVRRRAVARLDPPGNPAVGKKPADPGRPVYQRWQIIGLVAPAAFIAVVVSLALSLTAPVPAEDPSPDGTNPLIGMCVVGIVPELVDCSGAHDGRITDVVTDGTGCPLGTSMVIFDSKTGMFACVTETTQ
jgi:hypothetical protein